MTAEYTAATPRPEAFNLTQLSEENYARHRTKRYVIGVSGILVFILVVAYTIEGAFNAVAILGDFDRVFFVIAAALEGYLLFSLAWVPFRYWAPPPVALSVGPQGMDFTLKSGRRIHVPWDRDVGSIELLERVVPQGNPQESSFRIWVMWGPGDFERAWRRIVPLTYVPEAALRAVLEEAHTHDVSVELVEHAKSLSLVPTASRTAYVISRTSVQPYRPKLSLSADGR